MAAKGESYTGGVQKEEGVGGEEKDRERGEGGEMGGRGMRSMGRKGRKEEGGKEKERGREGGRGRGRKGVGRSKDITTGNHPHFLAFDSRGVGSLEREGA